MFHHIIGVILIVCLKQQILRFSSEQPLEAKTFTFRHRFPLLQDINLRILVRKNHLTVSFAFNNRIMSRRLANAILVRVRSHGDSRFHVLRTLFVLELVDRVVLIDQGECQDRGFVQLLVVVKSWDKKSEKQAKKKKKKNYGDNQFLAFHSSWICTTDKA